MLTVLASLCFGVGQGVQIPISTVEAVAVADWFRRCAELPTPPKLITVEINPKGYGTCSAPCYSVYFGSIQDAKCVAVIVDASSGDVVSAGWKTQFKTYKQMLKVWARMVKRLGRLGDLQEIEGSGEYVAAINGYPFYNMNGDTKTWVSFNPLSFCSYIGLGSLPPAPQGKLAISKEAAMRACGIDLKRDISPWKWAVHASPGLFYDEKTLATKWVWQVKEGFNENGKYFPRDTKLVDGVSGKVIDREDIQSPRFMYHSRPPGEGLKLLPHRHRRLPLFEAAMKRLSEINRPPLYFDSLRMGGGLTLANRTGYRISVNADGTLKYFEAPKMPGRFSKYQCLQLGSKIINAQFPGLPDGVIEMDPYCNETNPGVSFTQQAFGYPYLRNKLVSLSFDGVGNLCRFDAGKVAPKPSGVPRKILTAKEIAAQVKKATEPNLPKDTENIHYSVETVVSKTGWYVSGKTNRVRFAYEILVMYERDIENWGRQGGGTYEYFDAITGKPLAD